MKNKGRTNIPFLILLLLITAMVNLASAEDIWDQFSHPLSPDYDHLKLTSALEGQVRVIVKVRKHELFTNLELSIEQGRSRFIAEMLQNGIAANKELPGLALIVYELDEQQLDLLLLNPWVEEVVEDRVNRQHLKASRNYMGATEAQALGYKGAGAAVAILDTGFQTSHPHFAGRIVEEACYSSSSGTRYTSVCANGQNATGPGTAEYCTEGDCYHGTHVAGIAAGKHNNYGGVAPEADIIMVQVFTRATYASDCSPLSAPCLLAFDSDILAGMAYVESLASSYNIAAVNLSLGGGGHTSECTSNSFRNMKNQVADLKSLGIATIASSGNNGYTNAIGYPACLSDVVSVGSVKDTGNTISDFSNSASFLDFVAPGEPIDAAIPTWIFSNGLGRLSGTSMSAPHVSGAYTVLKGIDSSLSVDEMTALLKQQSVSFTDPRNGLSFPSLRLNTDNDNDGQLFLAELENGTDPEDASPVVTINAPLEGLTQLQSLSIHLSATATDAEDGNLGGSIDWSSSLDGNLGQGASLNVDLGAGSHTLIASVTDSQGATTAMSVDVTILADSDGDGIDDSWEQQYGITDPDADADADGLSNLQEYQGGSNPTDAAPTATIEAPVNNTEWIESAAISFIGTATDTEDGDLSSVIEWYSDIDGSLGVGTPNNTSLSAGTHTISLTVQDSLGASPVSPPTIQLTVLADSEADGMPDVWEAFYGVTDPLGDPDGDGVNNLAEYQQGTNPNDAPATITLLAPESDSIHTEDLAIDFLASAIDLEDGDISSAINWQSSIDGPLGVGSSLNKVLTVGEHTVTLTVTDSEAGVAQFSFNLRVAARGDIDGDGSWTALDVAALKDHVFGIRLLNAAEITRGDIAPAELDGQLTAADLYALEVLAYGSQQSPVDGDLDLLPDSWESTYSLNPADANDGGSFNSDGDALTNAQEYYYQTSPLASDTDGDSFSDSDEINNGFDPLNNLVYLNAPEFCGDGIDQNGDGLEIAFEDPADPNSQIVCEQVDGLVTYYVYDYSYQTDGQLVFTIDGSGNVTETRYRHDAANLGAVSSERIYHDNIFTELSAWKNAVLTASATNYLALASAPSASDIHNFLLERNRAAGRIHAQLLANGNAEYPLDEEQWNGFGHWAVAHESDDRRLRGFIIGAADTPSLKQRFSLAGFSALAAAGNLQLQIKGSDYSHAGHVDMRSRWVIRYYNEQGQAVGSAFVKSYVMDNSWQDRVFQVDIPVGAVEVQIELQMTLVALGKGQARNAIYNNDVPVYFDNIEIAALRRNTQNTIAGEALQDSYTLYNYSGGAPLLEPYYFLYNDNDQEIFHIDEQGLVSETVYNVEGRVIQRIVYGDSVTAALDDWLANNGNQQLVESDVRLFLGEAPAVTSQLDYNYSINASIGAAAVIPFSAIINNVIGNAVDFESVVNVQDGSAVIDTVAETITFTATGATGNESFDVIVAGGAETLSITVNLQ